MRAGRWLVLGDPSFLVFGALARRIKALDRPEIEWRLVDVKLPVVTAIFHPGGDEGICRLGYMPHVVYIHIMTRMDDLFDDVAGRCAAVRTLGTARVITRHFDVALRPVGLTITQFTLLVTIGQMKPESISQIGQWLNIDRTSLTRNLKPLEDAGYVTRGKEGPARKRKIDLTPAGAQILEKAYPLWQKAQGKVEARFSGDGYNDAKMALKSLRSVGSA